MIYYVSRNNKILFILLFLVVISINIFYVYCLDKNVYVEFCKKIKNYINFEYFIKAV